ncbi:hypothetical protein Tco_1037229, partial [Tanacetum coccineum]
MIGVARMAALIPNDMIRRVLQNFPPNKLLTNLDFYSEFDLSVDFQLWLISVRAGPLCIGLSWPYQSTELLLSRNADVNLK